MNIYLPGYSYGPRMCVVARREEVCRELADRGADAVLLRDDQMVFYPEGQTYDCSGVREDSLELLNDYDIVEIGDTGLLYRSFANREPDTTIFLGAKCNSNCIMCPAGDPERKNGFSYSRDTLLKYIDYLPDDLEYIVMTGGEPTMQTGLFLDALDAVKEKYPYTRVLLLTNGRSLSDLWLFQEVSARHPAHFRIAIPVHAATSELHDSITRAKGSFEQTMLALTRLMNSDISVEIRIVVTKVNCDHLLEIAGLITERFHRVDCVNFVALEPRGNCASNFDKVYIDHRNSFLKCKAAVQHLIAHGYDVGLYNYPLCALDRDYWAIAEKSIAGYKNRYHEDCARCEVKSICGGFFSAAMYIAKPRVFPVVTKEDLHE